MGAGRADRLRSALAGLVADAEEAGEDEPRYGVLVSLHRQADPTSPDRDSAVEATRQ